MKKSKVKALIVLVVAGIFCTGMVSVMASEDLNKDGDTRTIDDVTVTWECSLTENSGFACTVSNAGYIWTTTEADYYGIITKVGQCIDDQYVNQHHSNSGYYGSSVSFSAPTGYRSCYIISEHTANVPSNPIMEQCRAVYAN